MNFISWNLKGVHEMLKYLVDKKFIKLDPAFPNFQQRQFRGFYSCLEPKFMVRSLDVGEFPVSASFSAAVAKFGC